MATLGKDMDKKDVETYLTSPRRRSVVIDDERCVEIPIQMNPQLDASKLRSVAGRPPTPIPSDEEDDDEDEQPPQQQQLMQQQQQQQQQLQSCAGNSSLRDANAEGKLGSGEHVSFEDKPKSKRRVQIAGKLEEIGQEAKAPIEMPEPPAEGSRH